jgi:hypothetical protein
MGWATLDDEPLGREVVPPTEAVDGPGMGELGRSDKLGSEKDGWLVCPGAGRIMPDVFGLAFAPPEVVLLDGEGSSVRSVTCRRDGVS